MLSMPKLTVVTLFESMMSLRLPEGVYDMKEERVSQIYPMKDKPQVVKVLGDEKCWFSFSLLQRPLTNQTILDNLRAIRMNFERVFPSMLEEPITSITDETFNNKMYFSIVSKGREKETYQMIYIFPVKGKLMMGTICCDAEQQWEWKELFKKVIASIVDLTSTWEYRYNQKNLPDWIEAYYKEHSL